MRAASRSEPSAPAPTLGVVIPTLDEARTLPVLLRRLLRAPDRAASDTADHVVVVDGGSRDGTVAGARELGVEVVLAEAGRGAQLGAGAALLQSDVLLFLHADHLPQPGALTLLRRAFADPATGFAAMRQRIPEHGLFYRLVERAANARARRGIVYGDCGLAVRRELYGAVGGFRPLPLFEDLDLSRRLRRHGTVRWVGDAELCVSPRRWEHEGRLRCTLRNRILLALFRIGVDPARLVRLYPPTRS